MPKKLEEKLKKEYGAKSDIPYKIMNSIGVMHGNKETKKGKVMEKRQEIAERLRLHLNAHRAKTGEWNEDNDLK